jgi:hypothetical protein
MNIIYYLLFIFIAIRIYFLFFRKKGPKPVKNRIKEGFESLTNCLNQGYPNDFCMRAPIEACVTNCPMGTFLPKKFNTSF